MSDIIEALRNEGCDVEGALDRCLQDEEFYLSLLAQSVEDDAFAELEKCLKDHKIQEAFDCAHTLKGIMSNMGLTPVYNVVVKIVEPLRNGSDEGLETVFSELIKELHKIKDILKNMM